jgi:hypothetical protein
MSILQDTEGRNIQLFLDDYEYHSIATEDFSPSEDASATDNEIAQYCYKGYLVMPHADGTFYGITWRAYKDNNDSVDGLTPEIYKALDATWILCPFVKVYAQDDSSYANTAATINVAKIL